MGGHEAPAAGVHRDHLAQFGLDGAQIHYDLVPLHAVEGFYGHQGDRIDGGGQHHEVGLRDALFEREGKRAAYEAHARYQNFHTYI